MRIKKILYISLFFIVPFLIIIYFLFCINLILKDFAYGHKSHNFNPGPVKWSAYNLNYFKNNLFNQLSNIRGDFIGLKRVYIFIPEKTSNKLLENVPSSTKNYLRSSLLINNNIKDVRLRYLGDNPLNWLFHQKSMRIKTRKSEIINRQRYFEYKVSQVTPLKEYISFKLAKKLGLLVSDVKLVEVYVNRKSKGIYLEKSRLNESFLRKNKIMPVNMYKGEQSNNSENKIGLENDLFKNAGLWEKISIFNLYEDDDKRDLSLLIDNIKKAENSSEHLNKILDNGNNELFSKKSVLEILTQNSIGANNHNQRMVIDNWSGKIYNIPHDTHYVEDLILNENLNYELVHNDLEKVIGQSSHYLDLKYKTLFNYLVKKEIIQEIIEDLEKIKKKYLISEKRDIGIIQRKYFAGHLPNYEGEKYYNNIIKSLKKRQEELIKFFYKEPKASWENENDGFNVKVDQKLPLSNLIVHFKDTNPKWIAIDYNNNLILDTEDIYFYPNNKNSFLLNLSLYSNRVPILNLSKGLKNYQMNVVNTKFKFFVNNNSKPFEIFAYNKFSKEKFNLKKNLDKSLSPAINNFPIVEKIDNKIKIFEGDIFVNNNLILKKEVKIKKGTTFYLSEDASIIFKNKVLAEGASDNPIIFKRNDKYKKWGTIAIHGAKTKGSLFKNIVIDGGSGDTVDGINYFSSLSVHSTQNINFENILIKNNSDYDDMVHIVYSSNINFDQLNLMNAHKDAIDIDISENIYFKNSKIFNSGNDGLDLMDSSAIIDKTFITKTGDKGISVGEGSKLNLSNSTIENSNYGVASKDGSKVNIYNTLLKDNNIQLSTYQKNWRYGDSGFIEIKNYKISSKKENLLIGDNNGNIKILSTNIDGQLRKEGNVFILQ